MKKLWYDNEAKCWNEAIPIGNGRIGAMVYSGGIHDELQINEETLWSGYPKNNTKKHSMDEVEKIRRLVNEKRYSEATEEASGSMLNIHSQSYVPYGKLFIDIYNEKGEISDYVRELNMNRGIVQCKYRLDGISVTKEYFVSLKDDILVVNIKSSEPIYITTYHAVMLENSIISENECIVVKGRCPTDVSMYTNSVEYEKNKESIHFSSVTLADTNGIKYAAGNSLTIKDATDTTILFSIATSFNGYNNMPKSNGREYENKSIEKLKCVNSLTYDDLKERHIKEYQKYFNRVELEIEGENFDDIPTNIRIKKAALGIADNGLITLLFDFSRYLLISASGKGTQPMNLQGIWCDKMIAPWHSNYTMNINTEMNYWTVETCSLPEFHMPIFVMLKEFYEKGNNFGLRGWSAWHNSDIWRFNYEATNGVLWGYWQMGGFWLSRHIWEHYLHTRDVSFLREYYSVLTSACDFLEDWMYINPKDELSTCPSTSPENQFVFNGKLCAVCEGSAMDMSIIRDLFDKTIKSAKILGEDYSRYLQILSKLKPISIGDDGRILEWGEKFEESEPGHRHISHLYGFYPSDILNDKKYREAVKKTLEVRLENGGGHTGWSNAWIAAVYARLGEGENVLRHIINMFNKSIYPNMFDAHPPFQIDGNFGIAAAICEALMQSDGNSLKLIPAIPKEWRKGYVKGFVSGTGEIVNFKWENGKAVRIY